MLCDGDEFEHAGHKFRFMIRHDETMGAPWEEHDGHGPVSAWTRRAKRPGEMILAQDRGSHRYYDFAAAVKLARQEGWRAFTAGPGPHEGETAGSVAAEAAMANYEYLRRWCNDQWSWVGVILTLCDDHGDPIDGCTASLWGIESDAGDYFEEVAKELAEEILHDLATTLKVGAA